MKTTLKVVGGTYFEVCIEPQREPYLYGSGFRGAAAISDKRFDVDLYTCVGKLDKPLLASFCDTFEITLKEQLIEKTVTFGYYHPLSTPECINLNEQNIKIPLIEGDNILYYGLIEATATVWGDYVVYDPQNHITFKETGSKANHLAIVLNRNEAFLFSGAEKIVPLKDIGRSLLASQQAEVVVIKDGPRGALVIDGQGEYVIPVFHTDTVWPIGSGDVFSAVFAWQWAILKKDPCYAARLASQYTATFCNSESLPLPNSPESFDAIELKNLPKKIYLSGPFFTMAQRWLMNEFRLSLLEFGNDVFSPFHELGIATAAFNDTDLAKKVMSEITNSDLVFAILCDNDPGTLFEIGYARALNKQVLIYTENLRQEDLFMMYGSQCIIVSDFSTAIYKASW